MRGQDYRGLTSMVRIEEINCRLTSGLAPAIYQHDEAVTRASFSSTKIASAFPTFNISMPKCGYSAKLFGGMMFDMERDLFDYFAA